MWKGGRRVEREHRETDTERAEEREERERSERTAGPRPGASQGAGVAASSALALLEREARAPEKPDPERDP